MKVLRSVVLAFSALMMASAQAAIVPVTQNINASAGVLPYSGAAWPTPHQAGQGAPEFVFSAGDDIRLAEMFNLQLLDSIADENAVYGNGTFQWLAFWYNSDVISNPAGYDYFHQIEIDWADIDTAKGNGFAGYTFFTDGYQAAVGDWTVVTYAEGAYSSFTQFTVVSEPPAALLLALGVLGVATQRRLRKAR